MPEYDDDQKFLQADAILGHQCGEFWSTPVGRYIRGRAEKECQELLQDLYEAEPLDMKAQTEIRQDIALRALMLSYLDEQVKCGEQSRLELEDYGD